MYPVLLVPTSYTHSFLQQNPHFSYCLVRGRKMDKNSWSQFLKLLVVSFPPALIIRAIHYLHVWSPLGYCPTFVGIFFSLVYTIISFLYQIYPISFYASRISAPRRALHLVLFCCGLKSMLSINSRDSG